MTLIKDAETPSEVEWHIKSEAERWGLFVEEELGRGAHRYFKTVVKGMNISGEGNGNPLNILAWKISWMEEPDRLFAHGVTKSQTRLND